MSAGRIYVVAAEPSGDAFAAELVDAIRAHAPDTVFAGVGGGELLSRGIVSPFDISPLSIVGLFEGLKVYGQVVKLADETLAHIAAFRPDMVLLVDSWGFMIRVAQRVRKALPGIRLVKVIGPQVWATRAGRARKIADAVDHILCIHPFELPYYQGLDVETTVIGNPALGRKPTGDGSGFRARHGIDADTPVLLLLPGSRRSEARRVAPPLLQTASLVLAEVPDLRVVIAPSEEIAGLLRKDDWPNLTGAVWLENEAEKFDAMAAATVALACSGTVTTEAAMFGTPVVVAYRLGWLTWAIARSGLYKPRFINLMNIAAGREIVPEFVQTRCKPEQMAPAVTERLGNSQLRARQREAQFAALEAMGAGAMPAAERAARSVLADLGTPVED